MVTNRPDQVLRCLVTLVSKYRINSRVPFVASASRERIAELVRIFIEQCHRASTIHACTQRCCSTRGRRRLLEQQAAAANSPCLSWSACYLSGRAMYWNYALAMRILRSAYVDQPSLYLDGQCEPGERCFHRSTLPLLGLLQRKAWSEVRAKVMLTIRPKLPAELALEVFELVLAAEQIPMDPNVEDVKAAAAQSLVETAELGSQGWLRRMTSGEPPKYVRAKPPFWCPGRLKQVPRQLCHTQDWTPGSSFDDSPPWFTRHDEEEERLDNDDARFRR